jgi:hypothetical protein
MAITYRVSYTIYPGEYDPAPGRGHRPDMVGMTIVPMPNATKRELVALIAELQMIADQMK